MNKVDRGIDDLVQDTFLACVESRYRFEGRCSFRTYILRIAHHLVCDVYRRKRPHTPVDFERDSIVDLGAGPSTLFAQGREQRWLLEGLRRIPLESQIVLELHYWERLTAKQIGEVSELPENTVYSRLGAARKKLRKVLKQLELTPRPTEHLAVDLETWAESIRTQVYRDLR